MALINNGQILGTGSTDLILNTRGKIYVKVGDRFYELDFKNEGNNGESTIINNTTINNLEQDLSPYVTKKYLKAALGEYVTKRNWEDLMQTKDALGNAQLEGFTESITPITVNTMQMVVGTQNLQFDFITSLEDSTIVSPGLYINESGQLVCPKGFIKHYTLFGPESVKPETSIKYYARWTINGDNGGDYALLDLNEEDKPYYVYLRIQTPPDFKNFKDDYVTQHINEDPKGQYTGDWFASTQSHAIDEEEGYAYLLVALITGSNSGGRSIGYLNGFTEILPGQITAYVFKTADGNQYLDFLNNKFRIGNNDQYIDWNGERLSIKGSLSVIGGELENTLNNLKEQINNDYIKKAIKKGNTQITGGLVMTGLIELGFGTANPEDENYYDSFRVMSGINGILENQDENNAYTYTDPAIWFGGEKFDLESTENINNPSLLVLQVSDDNSNYSKYTRDSSTESRTFYKWLNNGILYGSYSESGGPFISLSDSEEPELVLETQPSGDIEPFYSHTEFIIGYDSGVENQVAGVSFIIKSGSIELYKINGTQPGNISYWDIVEGYYKQHSGEFQEIYLIGKHIYTGEGIDLTGTIAYKLDNNSIIFRVDEDYYSIRGTRKNYSNGGIIYKSTSESQGILPNIYERVEQNELTWYKWVSGGRSIYTLDEALNTNSGIYTIQASETPQYTSYKVVDFYNKLAKSMFRMDGSGYLANGSISWNTDGDINMNRITVKSGNIGPLVVSSDEDNSSVKVGPENSPILNITKDSISINGKLESYSDWNNDVAIKVLDPLNVQMFSVSAQPLSDSNIPIYVRRASSASLIYGKGSIMGGTVTIPANAYYSILEPQYIPGSSTYTIKKFELEYDIARIKVPIKGHILAIPSDEISGKTVLDIAHTVELYSWIWVNGSLSGKITENNLNQKEFPILLTSGLTNKKWGVYLYLEEGGQVKSGMASNSWIKIYATTNNEAEITLGDDSDPIPGTFIGSNGISSIFGKNTKFQWIVPSAKGYSISSDPRKEGGQFIVEIPSNKDQSEQVGIRITGYKGANGTSQTPGIQINTGNGWHTINITSSGITVVN